MTFRRLLGFLRPYRGQVIVSAVLAAGTQAAGLVIPYLTGAVIDSAQRGDGRRHIYGLAVLIVESSHFDACERRARGRANHSTQTSRGLGEQRACHAECRQYSSKVHVLFPYI